MIRTLITGYGYWGKILTKHLVGHDGFFVAGVHDPSPMVRMGAMRANLHAYRTLEDAIDATRPDLVVVATPIKHSMQASVTASTRYAHVMAAKPAATSLQAADVMLRAADATHRRFVVDYTLTTAPKWQFVLEHRDLIGDVQMVSATRTTLPGRGSDDVIEDLIVHDLSLVADFDASMSWRVEDVRRGLSSARVTLGAVGASAVLNAYRTSGAQTRVFRIVGSDGVMVWDQVADVLTIQSGSVSYFSGPRLGYAVDARLDMMRRVIVDCEPDNRRVFRIVTSLLEQANGVNSFAA